MGELDELASAVERVEARRIQRHAISVTHAPRRNRENMATGFWVTIGVMLAVALVAGGMFAYRTWGQTIVNRQQYDQLLPGMSYERAIEIVGRTATDSDASSFQGVGDLLPPTNAATCVWRNADGSTMVAVFVNDRLTFKGQKNLR